MERDKFSREKWADSIVRTIQRYLFAEITRITRREQWCKVSLRRGPFTLLYFAILWDKNLSRSAKEGRDYPPRRSIPSFPLSLVPSILLSLEGKKEKEERKGVLPFSFHPSKNRTRGRLRFPFFLFSNRLLLYFFNALVTASKIRLEIDPFRSFSNLARYLFSHFSIFEFSMNKFNDWKDFE